MNLTEQAEIIVNNIKRRNKPAHLFKVWLPHVGESWLLKSPSQIKGFYRTEEAIDDYVGTYTREVTVQQIIDDWF